MLESHTVLTGDSYCRAFNFPAWLSHNAYEQLMFIMLANDKGLSSLVFYFWHFPLPLLLCLSASVVGVAPEGFLSLLRLKNHKIGILTVCSLY